MTDEEKRKPFSNEQLNPLIKQLDEFFQQRPVRTMLDSIDSFFHQAPFNATFPVDMYETEHDIVIKANIPGVNREQITIEPMYDMIKISVLNNEIVEEENELKSYYKRERRVQRMERIIPLPFPVSEKKTTASYQNGILTIRTPKQQRKKRTIEIDE
ncbi:Hsp20/alpha crystallin family protein [Bacillus tianshenii]|nr:Hsp20/alpha crystallin family protein [Bacillus tianshenii]